MTDAVVIRAARPDEAFEVARLHVAADRETYQPIFGARFEAYALERSVARWDAALAAGDVLLVAEDRGALVGFAHAAGDWMSALYLLASHQRRGLGARLLATLSKAAQARGVSEFGFRAVVGNAGAIAFYEAMGARAVGRETEGEGEGAWENVRFALPLATLPALARR